MKTMKIRVLIVDDEPLARERIASLLKSEADAEILGECATGAQAVEAIGRLAPDLVFLDVQMPGMDGFEVLRAIDRERLPMVIFVTAFDQHALKAFEVHALDYLLKPFKQARFRETVQRARDALAGKRAGEVSKGLLEMIGHAKPVREFLGRIPVKTGERTIFVRTAQIDYIEAAGNYVVLHAGKENHVIRDTLTAIEEKVDPKKFIRINRSILVNVEQIKEVQPLFKGEHVLVLQNGKQLALSRGVRELEEALKFS